MKKICVAILCCIFLVACSSSYERDTSQGEIIKISLAQLQEKMDNNEDFTVVFTQEYCMYCQEFLQIYEEYRVDHHVVLYDVCLTDESGTPDENLAIIRQYFPSFSVTPSVYYVKNGKQESSLTDGITEMNEEVLENWVVEYQLDRK